MYASGGNRDRHFHTRSIVPLLLLAALCTFLLACREDEPTPTPEPAELPTGATVPVDATQPAGTAVAGVPPGPSPTFFETPYLPPTPTITPILLYFEEPTPTPSPTPTRGPLQLEPGLIYTAMVTYERPVWWSPTADEFIYVTCGDAEVELPETIRLFRTAAPNFEPVEITPDGAPLDPAICDYPFDLLWHPDGQRVLLTTSNRSAEGAADLLLMNRDGGDGRRLTGRYGVFDAHLVGWSNGRQVVFQRYVGGGYHMGQLLDSGGAGQIQLGQLFDGHFLSPGAGYVPLAPGAYAPDRFTAALPLPGTDGESGSPAFPLLFDVVWPGEPFQSAFLGWWDRAEREVALVTWEEGLLTETAESNIHIWDIDDGTTRLFFRGGRTAEVHPRHDLALITTARSIRLDSEDRSAGLVTAEHAGGPHVHVVRTGSGVVLKSLPMGELLIHAEGNQPAPPLTFRRVPLWNPFDLTFVYRDGEGEILIQDVSSGQSRKLTRQGGYWLEEVAWSGTGRYLSARQCDPSPCRTLIFDLKR